MKINITKVKGVSIEDLKKVYDEAIEKTKYCWKTESALDMDVNEEDALIAVIQVSNGEATFASYFLVVVRTMS